MKLPLKPWAVALLWFFLIWILGACLGPTDDEAYYWVLAQTPSLGYAFHPPAVAWIIALFGGAPHTIWLRLPAALISAGIVFLFLNTLVRPTFLLLSFAPLFGLSWMMVPDAPLFLAFTFSFIASATLASGRSSKIAWIGLFAGAALGPLSKFSGIAIPFSAVISFFLTASSEVRAKIGKRFLGISIIGATLGIAPSLVWNAQNDWEAIKFQLSGRHGDWSISFKRWFRFVLIQFAACGPALIAYSLFNRHRKQTLAWALPPLLIFGIQPLFSDFKPHWMLIAWFPFLIEWCERGNWPRAARFQTYYGNGLTLLVWALALFPLVPASVPLKTNVFNDLSGWKDWAQEAKSRYGEDLGGRWVVGGRYQTASQAAFALGSKEKVRIYPVSKGEAKEWGEIPFVSDRLLAPVLFVADNRYDAGPSFPSAVCMKAMHTVGKRFGRESKIIETWECQPK